MNSSVSINIDKKNKSDVGGRAKGTETSNQDSSINLNNEVISPIHGRDNEDETTTLSKAFIIDNGKASIILSGVEGLDSGSESDKDEQLNDPLHYDINSSSIVHNRSGDNRHRCPTCDPEEGEFISRLNRDEARINYNKGYTQLFFWILLLLSDWGLTRLICIGEEFPGDCSVANTYLQSMQDIEQLFIYGFVQGFFIDIIDRKRFYYIFHRKRWWFFLLFYSSGQIFAWLGNNPVTASSLDASSSLTTFQIIMYATLAGAVFLLMSFIIFHAYRVYPKHNFLTYIGSRLSVIVFYAIYFLLVSKENDTYHFHHYFIAWIISLFAQFQHPISVGLLAISCGIFVQGIGAYHADALFSNPPPDDDYYFHFEQSMLQNSLQQNGMISRGNWSTSHSVPFYPYLSSFQIKDENTTTFRN